MGERYYYSPKYTSTHWRMLLLAELHTDPIGQQLLAGAEYILNEIEMELRDIVAQGKHGLEWLNSRRGVNGRWRGSSPYRSRTFSELANKAEIDRWVTLHAFMILVGQLTSEK